MSKHAPRKPRLPYGHRPDDDTGTEKYLAAKGYRCSGAGGQSDNNNVVPHTLLSPKQKRTWPQKDRTRIGRWLSKQHVLLVFLPCHLLWMKQSSSISFMSSDGVCALAKSSASEHTQSASETCATPQWLLLSLNACGIICGRSVTIASSCLRHQRLSFPKVESIFLTPAISASKAARHSASSCSDSV